MEKLGTQIDQGLTTKDVQERLAKFGTNELQKKEDTPLWERIKESFDDLLVKILLIAATISFLIALTGKEIHLKLRYLPTIQ